MLEISSERYDESCKLAFDTLREGGNKADMIHNIEAKASCMKVAIMAAMFVGHMISKR